MGVSSTGLKSSKLSNNADWTGACSTDVIISSSIGTAFKGFRTIGAINKREIGLLRNFFLGKMPSRHCDLGFKVLFKVAFSSMY